MNIITVTGIGIVGALIGVLIRQYKPEYGFFVSFATGVVLTVIVVSVISPVTDMISSISQKTGINNEYTSALLKSLAVCYITQIATDCCRDAGENAIASKVEMCGRIAVLLLSLPLFRELSEIVTDLIA